MRQSQDPRIKYRKMTVHALLRAARSPIDDAHRERIHALIEQKKAEISEILASASAHPSAHGQH